MAGIGLLALIDDIVAILDDVAVMTKVATQKTAGVLGDDLALNAEQVSGVKPERELAVVWAVAKGSALNKAILVPLALGLSAAAPSAITPLLMLGGAFLCYEGFEKVAHKLLYSPKEIGDSHATLVKALCAPDVDVVAAEKAKIKGAIRTDFILSAEIVIITLGTVASEPLANRIAVLCTIAAAMTVGVYGLVAGIVKLDDIGSALGQRPAAVPRALGRAILIGAPHLMRSLSFVGTAAMFLVGGGIISHGLHLSRHVERIGERAGGIAGVGWALAFCVPLLIDAALGMAMGAATLVLGKGFHRLVRGLRSA